MYGKNNKKKSKPAKSIEKSFNQRLVLIFFCFMMSCVLIFLITAKTATNPFYREVLASQSSYTLTLPKQKGFIYDRNLTPLTNTSKSYIASVVPSQVDKEIIMKYTSLDKNKMETLLKQNVPFLCPVTTNAFSGAGITILETYNRYTEDDILTPHLIGYINSENKGVSGLEKSYSDYLEIEKQSSITYTVTAQGDPFNNVIPKLNVQDPLSKGVVTTIDKDIQQICEEVGNKYIEKGAIVVMNPYNGELISVCSFPNYSPLSLEDSVNDTQNSPMINRAFTPVSVGSTFKISTSATALDNGYSKFLSYDCKGIIDVGEDVHIKCHNLAGHGTLDMMGAMMNSCNPYFIKLGLMLEPTDILQTANNLSFGKSTKLAPNLYSSKGVVPTLEQLKSSEGAVANFSFGQGNFTGTPLQVAQMISSVLNDGNTPTPILVKGVCEDGENITEKTTPSYINAMTNKTANTIKDFLISCVMVEEDQNAKPNLTTAGGKTGTAQTGIFENGEELNNGWFAGFFPAEEPKYTVVVLTENATSGNVDASPIFCEIADKVTALYNYNS